MVLPPRPCVTKRAVAHVASNALRDRESAASLPRYLELRIGQRALLDSNDEGDGSVGTLFDDMDTVLKWAAGTSEPEELAHHDLPRGTPVSVQSWTHVKAVGGDDYVMIDVATKTEPRVEGYTQDIRLLPAIPRGTQLVVNSSSGKWTGMELRRDEEPHAPAITMAGGAPVSLLAVAPDGGSISKYRARVVSGPHRFTGWFNVFSLGAPSSPQPATSMMRTAAAPLSTLQRTEMAQPQRRQVRRQCSRADHDPRTRDSRRRWSDDGPTLKVERRAFSSTRLFVEPERPRRRLESRSCAKRKDSMKRSSPIIPMQSRCVMSL